MQTVEQIKEWLASIHALEVQLGVTRHQEIVPDGVSDWDLGRASTYLADAYADGVATLVKAMIAEQAIQDGIGATAS